MKTDQWAKDFQNYTDNPPAAGTVLRCYGGSDVRLDLELVDGKPPFLYGRMFVPHIVGQELGWFLQPHDSDAAYGWKCILLPKAREEAIRRLGITEKRLRVRALKIVRYSRTGQAVLCEVAEYCPIVTTVFKAPDPKLDAILGGDFSAPTPKQVMAYAADEVGFNVQAQATVPPARSAGDDAELHIARGLQGTPEQTIDF